MQDIRILSIRQPFAWLVVAGYKDVENRSWFTNYRGPLLIHAGLKVDYYGYDMADDLGIDVPEELDIGGIVGMVNLIDIAERSESRWWNRRDYAWKIGDAKELPFIECKGQVGLLRPKPDLLCKLDIKF
jgi:hypothetical protein